MQNFEWVTLLKATWETIYMVFISGFISIVIGGIIGFLLFGTKEKYLFPNKIIHQALGFIVNATRSVPFIILLISIIPLTRLIIGSTIGSNAAIVPLTLAAIPYFARLCENAFSEIPHELLETANALGVNTRQLIQKILIPESISVLIKSISLTIIGLIGYSAMAGAVGGGGLGELALNYGYQRFDPLVTLETVIILIIIVQFVQFAGDALAKRRQFKPIIVASILLGIASITSQVYSAYDRQNNVLRVGVSSGWSEEVMQVAQEVAIEKFKLHLKIVPFNDYILPNTALANGDIDANIFQHVPYLQAQIKANKYELVPVAKTFIYPLGFYSNKLHQLSELNKGALIAIPNDPSNQGRSLLLLQKAGLIALKSKIGPLAGIKDITKNPKQLRFKLLDAAQLPRTLQDADLVAITNDYVNAAGLKMDQALLREGKDSLYANVIVVNNADKNNPKIKELIIIMHSKQVLEKTQKIFPHEAAIPAW